MGRKGINDYYYTPSSHNSLTSLLHYHYHLILSYRSLHLSSSPKPLVLLYHTSLLSSLLLLCPLLKYLYLLFLYISFTLVVGSYNPPSFVACLSLVFDLFVS